MYLYIYIYFFEKRVSFLVRRTIRNPSLYQTWRFRTVMIHLGEAPIVGGRRHYLIDVLPLKLGESRVWLITGLINPNLNLLFHYPMIYPWNIPSSPEFASAKALFVPSKSGAHRWSLPNDRPRKARSSQSSSTATHCGMQWWPNGLVPPAKKTHT